MFWILLAVLVLLSIAVLALTALSFYRRVKVVGAETMGSLEQVVALVDQLKDTRGPAPAACPTCGGPIPPVTSRAPAASPIGPRRRPAGVV